MAAEVAAAAQQVPPGAGTVSTLGERCELGGAGHRESRIARRNALDDIASRLTLVYQSHTCLAAATASGPLWWLDASLVEAQPGSPRRGEQ